MKQVFETPGVISKFATSTDKKLKAKTSKDPGDSVQNLNWSNHVNLSGISPIVSPGSKKYLGSKQCSGPKRRVMFKEKKADFLKARDEKMYRKKILDLEVKMKRQENELTSSRARINTLTTQLKTKDCHIRDLELRLPRVLADISRGVGNKEALVRKNNKDMKDTMTRNHQLSKKVSKLEQQLQAKEEKEKSLKAVIEKWKNEVVMKEREHKKVMISKTGEMEKMTKEKGLLEEKFSKLENQLHVLELKSQSLEDQFIEAGVLYNKTLGDLRQENHYLYKEVSDQYDEILQTEEELKKIEVVVDTHIRNCPSLKKSMDASELTDFNPTSRNMNVTWPVFAHKGLPNGCSVEDDGMTQSNFMQRVSGAGNPFGSVERGLLDSDYDDPFGSEDHLQTGEDVEFNNSAEESIFYSRVENLDLKLEFLLNHLNSTISSSVNL